MHLLCTLCWVFFALCLVTICMKLGSTHALLVPFAPFLLIEVTRIFWHTEVRNDFKVTHCHCWTLESPWICIWSPRLLSRMVPLVCTAIGNHFAMCCKIFCTLCVLSTSFINFESSSSSYLSTFLHLGYKFVHPVLENWVTPNCV